MIKLTAFDLDGTLGNTLPMCLKAFRASITPYLARELSYEEIASTFGLNEAGMMKKIVGDKWEPALQDFHKLYKKIHHTCPAPYDGIPALIQYLKANGVTVSLITGKGSESCSITLNQWGLDNVFSDILTGGETRNTKAKSMLFLLRKYGLSPSDLVYIGDTASDIKECHKAGVTCLSALWGDSAEKEMISQENPDHVFYSIADLKEYITSHISL
ncbi:Pyrophosphatase PpaX [Blautia producta]|uniref:Pyrophosphatase PpaX n=1 Tax=Blautia producta TaxID=33035 RepID=A0A4P6LUZ4_9FIRM|nr:HAD hydrolase-like protein [Blautia producta]QBE96254.1 Pyrophosphatase PpaX [Blautia producta]